MGITLAIPVVLVGPGALALVPEPIGAWPGGLGMIALVLWLHRVATNRGQQ